MDITIYPAKLTGTVQIIPSKSQAHRLLICAAFANKATEILCPETNEDISATVDCLNALGAKISRMESGYYIFPAKQIPKKATLNCRESGSTLRFLLPIAGALGVEATFQMAGRLPNRPLSPLQEEMERMGCSITRSSQNTLLCTGKLRPGSYSMAGNVSSQFITGLLFALILLDAPCTLNITGKIESKPYIEMTRQAILAFGGKIDASTVSPSLPLKSPGTLTVEGDWSNGAFFLAANALGNVINIQGLKEDSPQGDRICQDILSTKQPINISASDIPDLVPILSIVAAAGSGGEFSDITRLRLKESDRVASTIAMLNAFGIEAVANENTLIVFPGKFYGCTINSQNDHRIAMSAAIAATIADGPVTILGAQCVSKSYPAFWEVYKSLGGSYEQHIR
ncbi:MAG: 3-phosphoshikimate 1-carboxyvinyltransferase [Ruminococcaceae bacterium]|nr:3-phosphoshikimate 1-carboxyvinyltransferase [Oscillospiraceae bacterium]